MEGLSGLGVAITGGAGDIGAAMGAELTRLGAAVTLIDRKSAAAAEPWLDRARAHGDVAYIAADVRDRGALDAALAAVTPLDVAIGNAAIGHGIPFLEISQEQWQVTVQTLVGWGGRMVERACPPPPGATARPRRGRRQRPSARCRPRRAAD